MPLTVKHSKVSPVADGPDTNLVRPSDWNADHQITGLDNITDPVAVSVNSASPALKITQTGAGNALVVEDAASDSTPFVIDASGKVIAGHTAATSGAYGDNATLFNIGAGFVPRTFSQAYSADSFAPVVELAKSRNATGGAHTIVLSGDELGAVRFAGSDGAAFREAARIQAIVDGTPGTNDMPGRLAFSTTADGASTPTERMRIDSAGNVHVGNAYSGSVANQDLLRIRNTNAGGVVRTQVINPSTTASTAARVDIATGSPNAYGILGITENGSGAATIELAAGAGVTSGMYLTTTGTAPIVLRQDGNERLRIDSSGNVLVRSAVGLGYGTGAGGTVTQVTSKSTAVTLNTPSGVIVTHSEIITAGASVGFQVSNSVAAGGDVVLVGLYAGAANFLDYRVEVVRVAGGLFQIRITNVSAASKGEALQISYVVLKGASS